jgi:hypothetical protein
MAPNYSHALLLSLVLCLTFPGLTQSRVRHFVFGLSPSASFDVRRNNVLILQSLFSTEAGSLTFDADGIGGFEVVPAGDMGTTQIPRLLLTAPNPYTCGQRIRLHLPPGATTATICVYNALGERVRTLFPDPPPEQTSGYSDVAWDGRTESKRAPQGMYLVEARAGSDRTVRKILLLRR